MEFIKFPSLTNAYKESFVNKCALSGIPKWDVTEKVHGANMGVYCDGTDIKIASRNGFVGTGFYGQHNVMPNYYDDIKDLFNNIEGANYIIVYGEFFGGLFEGKSEPNSSKVQKGIDYIPFNDFLAFNVYVISDTGNYWIGTSELGDLLHERSLNTVPVMFTGSLQECLQHSNDFQSTIPALYGLKTLDNVTEGTVITPTYGEDYQMGESIRGIKNKNSKWAEKVSAPKPVFEPDDSLANEAALLVSYATENRFQNVLSKEGEFDQKLIGKYIGLLTKDCWDEFLSDGNLPPENKQAKKYVNSQLLNKVREIVLKGD